MEILETPADFRGKTHRYPGHQAGKNIEEAFDEFIRRQAPNLKTKWVYLPIFWQNNLFAQKRPKGGPFRARPEVQAFLNRLNPNTRYFTVTVADEGMYEHVPPNVTIFGAGGTGSIPIPLLCTPHPCRIEVRNKLAFFMGNIETGGPVASDRPPSESSWDPNGAGARVRRRMRDVLANKPGFMITDGRGNSRKNLAQFRDESYCHLYGLAPRGYGKTSYRLYEVMQMGCVPVYIYDQPWIPYTDVLDWNEFSIICPIENIDALPAVLESRTQEDWLKMRDVIRSAWNEFFTIEGCCHQILRYVMSQKYEPKYPVPSQPK